MNTQGWPPECALMTSGNTGDRRVSPVRVVVASIVSTRGGIAVAIHTGVMTPTIHVYGTDWCRLTFAVREHLMQLQVEYDYFDIERDPRADEFVRAMHDGRRRHPIVVIGAHIVTNPTLTELRRALDQEETTPRVDRP
jgi:glutaredoxin